MPQRSANEASAGSSACSALPETLASGEARRSTAFTSPAAEYFRARFTNSTDSSTAACAGTRSRKRNW